MPEFSQVLLIVQLQTVCLCSAFQNPDLQLNNLECNTDNYTFVLMCLSDEATFSVHYLTQSCVIAGASQTVRAAIRILVNDSGTDTGQCCLHTVSMDFAAA